MATILAFPRYPQFAKNITVSASLWSLPERTKHQIWSELRHLHKTDPNNKAKRAEITAELTAELDRLDNLKAQEK